MLTIGNGDGQPAKTALGPGPLATEDAMERVVLEIASLGLMRHIATVGHRIVHGGRDLVEATVLDDPTLAALRSLVPLAPLHQPVNLDIGAAATRLFP
ncbi:acetate kinase, partial [Rhizobiaceae sp. 2RAB30]